MSSCKPLIVWGIGTAVGKTVVSAILVEALEGEYWKPIQSGNLDESDSHHISRWAPGRKIHPEAYRFQAPLSPHHAAACEGMRIESISLPKTNHPLILETSGGVMVPMREDLLQIDLWNYPGVLVSSPYLGSLNHTLLTIEVLKARQRPLLGLIFNGEPYPEGEAVLTRQVPCIGRVLPEKNLTQEVIHSYAHSWRKTLCQLF